MSAFPESAAVAWRERFGDALPLGGEAFGPFLARRSVRRFDERPVSAELVRALIGAGQSASTSSNLQAWSAVMVREPERRARITQLVGDQKSVATAPVFLAFLLDLRRLEVISAEAGAPANALGTTEMLLTGAIDAALAAERLMGAAEAVGLGGCYIGGLRNHPEEVAALLGLPPHVFGLFGLALGYPDPARLPVIKPRLRPEAVLHEETYRDPDFKLVAEYEERLAAFDQAQRPNPDRPSWAAQSGRRASRGGMSGREGLRESLARQGLGTE